MRNEGAIIILAYPDTIVTPTAAFYNKILSLIGIIQSNKIGAGHAACVLVDPQTGELDYADFGRYITPIGKGRIRSKKTDPEVELPLLAQWPKDGEIQNLEEILLYLEAHPEKTHGDGRLIASVSYDIDFIKAKKYLTEEQNKGSIAYGPFTYGGSNCTRFVADMMIENTNNRKVYRKLRTVLPTPTTVSNVLKGKTIEEAYEVFAGKIKRYNGKTITNFVRSFARVQEIKEEARRATKVGNMEEPKRSGIPKTAQWLSGIGAGSWFFLVKREELPPNQYRIQRIMPDGTLAFEKIFKSSHPGFEPEKEFEFTYDCNAQWCTIKQHNNNFRLECISKTS